MADDLNDDWWLREDSVSDDELKERDSEQDGTKSTGTTSAKKTKKLKPSSLSKSAADSMKSGTKRKADVLNPKDRKSSKKKRKESASGKKHERKRITDESDETLAQPGSADDVRAMMTKALKDRMGEQALDDCLPDSESDFYPHNTDLLEPSKYLSTILPKWRATVKKSLFMKKNGSPSLLVVTSSAIRAVELNRQIKGFLDEKCKVAKLFAKHMKVEDQKKFLLKTNCQVGIGTPGRLLLLIKQGILQLESLVAVVLDWNWRDTKLKRMADILEIRQDLVTLLRDFVLEAVQGSPCKLALL